MADHEPRHPARWTPAVLRAIEPVVSVLGLPVHDPFAGTGERLGALCDMLGLRFSGTELEPEFIVDPRVEAGDSADLSTYPHYEHVVVTSPAYPNGMSDHFNARDGSVRHTYRQALAETIGYDRPLRRTNMGRYSVRSGNIAESLHFDIAACCVRRWPNWVVVNVSDFVVKGGVYPLVAKWRGLLEDGGYEIISTVDVATPRQRHGAHGRLRVDHETVIVANR